MPPMVTCPECGALYGVSLRKPGDKCGNTAWTLGHMPCTGVVKAA